MYSFCVLQIIISEVIPSRYVPHLQKTEKLHQWFTEQEKLGKILMCEQTGIKLNREKCIKGTFLTATGKVVLAKSITEAMSRAKHVASESQPKKFVSSQVTSCVTFAQALSPRAADVTMENNSKVSVNITPFQPFPAPHKTYPQSPVTLTKPVPAPRKVHPKMLVTLSKPVPAPRKVHPKMLVTLSKPVPAPRKVHPKILVTLPKPDPAPRNAHPRMLVTLSKPVPAPREVHPKMSKTLPKPVPAPRKLPTKMSATLPNSSPASRKVLSESSGTLPIPVCAPYKEYFINHFTSAPCKVHHKSSMTLTKEVPSPSNVHLKTPDPQYINLLSKISMLAPPADDSLPNSKISKLAHMALSNFTKKLKFDNQSSEALSSCCRLNKTHNWTQTGKIFEIDVDTHVIIPHSRVQNIYKCFISKETESKRVFRNKAKMKKESPLTYVHCPDCSEICRTQDRWLNHFLKQHVKETKRMVGGGPPSSVSKQRPRVHSKLNSPRINAANIWFPNVRNPVMIKLLENCEGMKLTPPFDSEFSPPISTIDQIKKSVDQTKNPVKCIQLDYGNFAWPDFLHFQDIYMMKEIKQEVEEEKKWLDQCRSLERNCYERAININHIDEFINIIHNSSSPVQHLNGTYRIEDLKTLCCSRWLTMDTIMYVAGLLTKNNNIKNTVIINANENLQKEKLTKTISNLQKTYGSRLKEMKFIFVMHIGVSNTGTHISSLRKQGNHFSMATYDLGKAEVIYADSLAWPVPHDLISLVNSIALQTANVSPNFRTCHTSVCGTSKTCTPQCAQFYPRQRCSSACGIAVIIGVVLSYLDKEKYSMLIDPNLSRQQLAQLGSYSHLSDISEHSLYLRCCIISWIMSSKIDVQNVLKKMRTTRIQIPPKGSDMVNSKLGKEEWMRCDNVNIVRESNVTKNQSSKSSKPKTGNQKSIKAKGNLCKKNEGPWQVNKIISVEGQTFEYSFDFSPIQSYLKRKPCVFYRKHKQKIDLECLLMNGTKKTKTFKLDNGIDGTLSTVQAFVSSGAVEWLECHIASKEDSFGNYKSDKFNFRDEDREIFYRCEFNHLRSTSHMRITVHLLDGTTKHKLFKCSESGANDERCNVEIQDFLDNEFHEFVSEKWEEIEKVPTGDKTREYIDNIPFNTKIQWKIHESIDVSDPPNAVIASLNEHPRWGKTLRIDSSFSSNSSNIVEEVVKLTVRCTSKTNACKSQCGMLLHSMPKVTVDEPFCSNCGTDVSCHKQCNNCKVNYSSRWVKVDGVEVCNKCYLYFNKHSHHDDKQANTSNDTIKRHQHLLCKWKLKFVLNSTNLNEWIVYQSANNKIHHDGEAMQHYKKMSLTDRDRIDQDRVTMKATPRQLELSLLSSPVTVGDRALPPSFTKAQLKKRFQTLDRHVLKQSMGNGVQPSQSQWENTEKILSQNTSKVLFFQRGDATNNRNYHIILASDENIECLSKHGKNICGYDIKHDFNEMRLKTGALTYCDAMNKGRVGAFTISNSETAETHLVSWQIILSNLKCSQNDCDHERKLYIFNDGNGFLRLRPCVLQNGPEHLPFIQHDKDASLLNASKGMKTKSSLCNFHALQRIRDMLKKPMYRELHKFLEPIMFGFKCIMRTYNTQSRKSMQDSYVDFINDAIPGDIVSQEEKESFVDYLKTFWFNSRWCDTYTAEVMYAMNEESRRNPLVLTNNITERKFRDIDESLFNCKMNKLVSNQVNKFMNHLLVSEAKLTVDSEKEYEKKGLCVHQPFTSKQKLFISKALCLIDESRVRFLSGSKDHGWVAVNVKSTEYKDQDSSQMGLQENVENYMSSEDEEDVHYNYDTEYDMQGKIGAEHSYSAMNTAVRTVSRMKHILSNNYKDVLMSDAPYEVKQASTNGYVCNLSMGVCTCISFITMGQPKFCKHLYACIAMDIKERDEKKIFQAYVNHIPKLLQYLVQSDDYKEIQKTKEGIDWSSLRHIIESSHIPSQEEQRSMKLGVLVSEMCTPVGCEQDGNFIGRPKSRLPHRGGFRKKYNDTFVPNVIMPVDSRKRKVNTEQGFSKRKDVKRKKVECDNSYNEQMFSIAESKVQMVNKANSKGNINTNKALQKPHQNTNGHQTLSSVNLLNDKERVVLNKVTTHPLTQPILSTQHHYSPLQHFTLNQKEKQQFLSSGKPMKVEPGNTANTLPQYNTVIQQPTFTVHPLPTVLSQYSNTSPQVGLKVVLLNINGILQPVFLS